MITFADRPNFDSIIESINENTPNYVVGWDDRLGNIIIFGEYNTYDEAVAEVRSSQEEDMKNILDIKYDSRAEVIENDTPCICYIFDVRSKEIETIDEWIIQ